MGKRIKSKLTGRKVMLSFLLSFFIFSNILVFLLFPNKVEAVAVMSNESLLSPTYLAKALKTVISKRWLSLTGAMFTRVLTILMEQLAFQSAKWLASSLNGQEPVYRIDNWGKWLENNALSAAGEFLADLNERYGGKGFDFCNPDFNVFLQIQFGLPGMYNPAQPQCDFKASFEKYRGLGRKYAFWKMDGDSPDAKERRKTFWNQFQHSIEPGNNDFGAFITLNDKTYTLYKHEEEVQKSQSDTQKDTFPIADMVTGKVKTPSSMIQKIGEEAANAPEKGRRKLIDVALTFLPLTPDYWIGIGGMFLNTFASSYIEQRIMKGFLPKGKGKSIPSIFFRDQELLTGDTGELSGQEEAEQAFEIQKPMPIEDAGYDLLGNFVICPDNYTTENCVMDQGLNTAIQMAKIKPLTIYEAMDAKNNYLHADWLLIPPSNQRNGEKDCYMDAYCYSNIAKLRLARILPLGFEIAAKNSSINAPAKLKEVVDNFSNKTSPWYHLIDPNWVIRFPTTLCRAKTYGPTLTADNLAERAEVCADIASCIKEGDSGSCESGAYGYCTREKNIWRFAGTSCPSYYNTCLSLTRRDGVAAAYLGNTVDDRECVNAESSVGCRWFSLKRDTPVKVCVNEKTRQPASTTESCTSSDQCKSGYVCADNWLSNAGNRLYGNRYLKSCAEDAGGCGQFIKLQAGIGTNLLVNGGFEDYKDGRVWSDLGAYGAVKTVTDPTVDNAAEGSYYFQFNGGNPSHKVEIGYLVSDKSFVWSFYAKNCSGSYFADNFKAQTIAYSDVWARQTYPIYYSPESKKDDITLSFKDINDGCQVDGWQLEEVLPAGGSLLASEYKSYGAINNIYLKKAPDYLNCQGNKGDNAECAKYAMVCNETEVGCESYTPTNGESAVAGKVSNSDYCPAECDGYDTFKQSATYLDKPEFPVYLIPRAARTCSSASVGCEEFTNLDQAALGGEALEYYSYVRQCSKPNGDTKAFYIWEGSDVSGYQLKRFLLQSNNDAKKSPKTYDSSDLVTDPLTDPPTYNDSACDLTNQATKGDCREFYDDAGNIFRRLYSRTITASENCHPYRKTIPAYLPATNYDECYKQYGVDVKWDADNSLCTKTQFDIVPNESYVCPASAAGCREYIGNSGNNIKQIFFDDFDAADGGKNWPVGESSEESLDLGGKSWKAKPADGSTKAQRQIPEINIADFDKGKIFVLKFWAKSVPTKDIPIAVINNIFLMGDVDAGAAVSMAKDISLTSEWKDYSIGPVVIDKDLVNVTGASYITLNFSLDSQLVDVYLDNVKLEQIQGRQYLIKNSWKTPASCDSNPYGAPAPQYMLGCQGYTDRAANTHYLKSFTELCRAEAVGCEALIDTKNSSSPYEETYNNPPSITLTLNPNTKEECYKQSGDVKWDEATSVCTTIDPTEIDDLTVPADSIVYLVNNIDKQCVSEFKGCMVLGAPNFKLTSKDNSAIETITSYDNTYYVNDPDNYLKTLCTGAEDKCELYRGTEGDKVFKNPGDQTCEYRENQTIASSTGAMVASGWFKKGTTDSCQTITVNGQTFDYAITPTSDSQYAGWVGTCTAANDLCTEFVDPSDKDPLNHPNGFPYYYLDNPKLTEKSSTECGGLVSKKEGCVLFNNKSNAPAALYCGVSTYADSAANNNKKVAPHILGSIDCAENQLDSNQILKVIQDRTCGSWLACRSYSSVWDENSNNYRQVCNQIDLCDGYTASQLNRCSHWTNNEDAAGKVLTDDLYQRRDTSWDGMDYSGLSIMNKFQSNDLLTVDLNSSKTEADNRLIYKLAGACYVSQEGAICPENYCVKGSNTTLSNGCGPNSDCGTGGKCATRKPTAKYCLKGTTPPGGCNESDKKCEGSGNVCAERSQTTLNDLMAVYNNSKCYNNKCVVGVDGEPINDIKSVNALSTSCRGYTESTAPFDYNVVWDNGDEGDRDESFSAANYCEPGENCDCSYKKVGYGDTSSRQYNTATILKYYPLENQKIINKICYQGEKDGDECESDNDCKEKDGNSYTGPGTCQSKMQTNQILGWRGYCLQPDYHTAINGQRDQFACLTWMPLEMVSGDLDIYNYYPRAGYNVDNSNGGEYYCTMALGNGGNSFQSAAKQEAPYFITIKDEKPPPSPDEPPESLACTQPTCQYPDENTGFYSQDSTKLICTSDSTVETSTNTGTQFGCGGDNTEVCNEYQATCSNSLYCKMSNGKSGAVSCGSISVKNVDGQIVPISGNPTCVPSCPEGKSGSCQVFSTCTETSQFMGEENCVAEEEKNEYMCLEQSLEDTDRLFHKVKLDSSLWAATLTGTKGLLELNGYYDEDVQDKNYKTIKDLRLDTLPPIYKGSIERIDLHVYYGNAGDWPANYTFSIGRNHLLYDNDYQGPFIASTTVDSFVGTGPLTDVGYSDTDPNYNDWMFYWARGAGSEVYPNRVKDWNWGNPGQISPFQDGACQTKDNNSTHHYGNYAAAQFLFDENDRWIGIKGRHCDSSGGYGTMLTKITFVLRAPCLQLSRVVSDTGENKAWTDAVGNKGGVTKIESNVYGDQFQYNTIVAPYGSASLQGSAGSWLNKIQYVQRNITGSFDSSGLPFTCVGDCGGGSMVLGSVSTNLSAEDEAAGKLIACSSNKMNPDGSNKDCPPDFSCENGTCVSKNKEYYNPKKVGLDALSYNNNSLPTDQSRTKIEEVGKTYFTKSRIPLQRNLFASVYGNWLLTSLKDKSAYYLWPEHGDPYDSDNNHPLITIPDNLSPSYTEEATDTSDIDFSINGYCSTDSKAKKCDYLKGNSDCLEAGYTFCSYSSGYCVKPNVLCSDKKPCTVSGDKCILANHSRHPVVASVNFSPAGQKIGKYPVLSLNKISVDDQEGGIKKFNGGQASVKLNFYAWTDKNQMPIRAVYIDWGDGTDFVGGVGKYKNHKPYCGGDGSHGVCDPSAGGNFTCQNKAECKGFTFADATTIGQLIGNYMGDGTYSSSASGNDCVSDGSANFGNTADACQPGYFSYSHSYICDIFMAEDEDCDGGSCCKFVPKVKVIDNWDRCTGDLSKDWYFGKDCYDDTKGWTKYDGEIRVFAN